MKKEMTANVFADGLIMDMNPLVTPDSCLTNALNATFITMNGNENMLQQDMGNGRVETAYLPEGYVPVGTAELGGIIYIVSYNPLIDRCQIGSFPSPERNVTTDEISDVKVQLVNGDFQGETEYGNLAVKTIRQQMVKKNLLNDAGDTEIDKLYPGDKYKVYVTNNGGISNNVMALSDTLGNADFLYMAKTVSGDHYVDAYPKRVTMHVAAITDDGKITYLDSSQKWYASPDDYYLQEMASSDGKAVDLDEYRTLVSTAYNVFNSKVSGELALVAELKTIDSFSVTWDAQVGNTGDDVINKKATFRWFFNWTSTDPRINPYCFILSQSSGDYADVDSVEHDPGDYVGDALVVDIDAKTAEELERANDGLDNDVIADDFTDDGDNVESIVLDYSTEDDNEYVWHYEWTPAMKFGAMEWLAMSGYVNLKQLGSGNIRLDEWRYYIQENSFYLSWGLECYPEYGKSVDRVLFTFIPFDDVANVRCTLVGIDNESGERAIDTTSDGGVDVSTKDKNIIGDIYIRRETEDEDEGTKYIYPRYTVEGKGSYSGNFQEVISFDSENGQVKSSYGVRILKNYLYLVAICVVYGNSAGRKYIYDYRWLYTTGQWNATYLAGSVTDFGELYLDDVLTYTTSIDHSDGIVGNHYQSSPSLPSSSSGQDDWTMMGMDAYAVGYDTDGRTFNGLNEVTVNVGVEVRNFPELFSVVVQDGDAYVTAIGNKAITRSPDNTTNVLSSTTTRRNTVLSTTMDGTTNADGVASAVGAVVDGGPITSDVDANAVDFFDITSTADGTFEGSTFTFSIFGAAFDRINADLADFTTVPSQVVRPFLFYVTDLNTFGMFNKSTTGYEMRMFYVMSTFDRGGGQPFSFNFFEMNAVTNGYTFAETFKDTDDDQPYAFDEGDEWETDHWYDSKLVIPYTHILNDWMTNVGTPFVFLVYDQGVPDHHDGPSKTTYDTKNGTSLQLHMGIWVRSEDDHYLPIMDHLLRSQTYMTSEEIKDDPSRFVTFQDNANHALAMRVINFLMQLYYVDSDSSVSVNACKVGNIIYLSKYTETWSVDMETKLNINDVQDTINLVASDGSKVSLNSLAGTVSGYGDGNAAALINDSPGFDALMPNITYDDREGVGTLGGGTSTYSHSFSMNTDELYELYEGLMNSNVQSAWFIGDEEGVTLGTSVTRGSIYVFNKATRKFQTANSSNVANMMYYSSVSEVSSGSDYGDRLLLSQATMAAESSELADNMSLYNNTSIRFKESGQTYKPMILDSADNTSSKEGKACGVVNYNYQYKLPFTL